MKIKRQICHIDRDKPTEQYQLWAQPRSIPYLQFQQVEGGSLAEVLAWKRGWDFVYRVAATVLHQKSDSPPKMENYSIYLLFFFLRSRFSCSHVSIVTCTLLTMSLRWRYCADIDGWFGVNIDKKNRQENNSTINNNTIVFQCLQYRAVTLL